MNASVTAAAASSAATIDTQIPSMSKISGRRITAATCSTKVLKKEISAEVRPSLSAVKKDEPKIAKPANKNEKEKILKPLTVRSYSPLIVAHKYL